MVTGSRAFFSGLEGFHPHDMDVVVMVEKEDVKFEYLRQSAIQGYKCVFEVVRRPKQEIIDFAIKNCPPMVLCRFLTPDFAKEIGLEINDLMQLKSMYDSMDEKHKYLNKIFDAYIANKDFFLTDEQRQEAFKEYQKERGYE